MTWSPSRPSCCHLHCAHSFQNGAAWRELWDYLVPQREHGEVHSDTCPQLVLSSGKNCSETTSCYIIQSQSQGTAVWAFIFAPSTALCFPEQTADTTPLTSPSTRKQAKRRKAGMLWRVGISCVILHNSTDSGGFR